MPLTLTVPYAPGLACAPVPLYIKRFGCLMIHYHYQSYSINIHTSQAQPNHIHHPHHINNSTFNMDSTAEPASSALSNSTTSQPESEFNLMVCITQRDYLLSMILVTILLLLLLFVVLLIVCCCCRKKDKPKQQQHKDQGKIETKQSKTSTGKNAIPMRQPKRIFKKNEPPRIDEIDEMQQDFKGVDVPDTVDIDEQDCKPLEVPVEQECEGVDVPDTVEDEDYDHEGVEVPVSIEEEDGKVPGKKRRTFIKAKEAKKRDKKHKDLHHQKLQPATSKLRHVGPLPLKDEDHYPAETDQAENKPKKKPEKREKTTSQGKKGADDKPAEMKSEKRKKTTSLGKKGADDKPAEMKSEQKPAEDTMKEEESSGFKVMPMPTDAITDTQTAYHEPKEVLSESEDKPQKEEDGVTQESFSDSVSDDDDDDDNDND